VGLQCLAGVRRGRFAARTCASFRCIQPANFIEATDETPYFQVGESNKASPCWTACLTPATPLAEAAKCVLVSMDSTMKSNLSVGLPLDLVVYEADTYKSDKIVCIDNDKPLLPHDAQQLGTEAARSGSTASKTRCGTTRTPTSR